MRLAVCAMSAVLLSGCSWLGGGHSGYGYSQAQKGQHYGQQGQKGAQAGQYGNYGAQGGQYGGSNGFPQTPNFSGSTGAATYATGGYGSHAANAGQQNTNYASGPELRKPRLRGSLSLGVEKNVMGAILDFSDPSVIDYNPDDYMRTVVTGTPADGNVTTSTYTAVDDNFHKNQTLSFDDIYSTPARIAGGLEYIASPHLTVFANGGYSVAEGKSGSATVDARLQKTAVSQDYVGGVASGAPVTTVTRNPSDPLATPSHRVATYEYDFNDMRRIDLEVGGRYYFNPIVKDQAHRTLTPFVGASVGASHHNQTDYSVNHQQVYFETAFETSAVNMPTYTLAPKVTVFDAQWVPSGALTAGMEWQVTPKSAIALETGMRFEKARDYANGAKGDSNIAVPVTLRGSFNF